MRARIAASPQVGQERSTVSLGLRVKQAIALVRRVIALARYVVSLTMSATRATSVLSQRIRGTIQTATVLSRAMKKWKKRMKRRMRRKMRKRDEGPDFFFGTE